MTLLEAAADEFIAGCENPGNSLTFETVRQTQRLAEPKVTFRSEYDYPNYRFRFSLYLQRPALVEAFQEDGGLFTKVTPSLEWGCCCCCYVSSLVIDQFALRPLVVGKPVRSNLDGRRGWLLPQAHSLRLYKTLASAKQARKHWQAVNDGIARSGKAAARQIIRDAVKYLIYEAEKAGYATH